ncbi:hypothetical protein G9A89_000235, partial [Geosiphon pyriformis]
GCWEYPLSPLCKLPLTESSSTMGMVVVSWDIGRGLILLMWVFCYLYDAAIPPFLATNHLPSPTILLEVHGCRGRWYLWDHSQGAYLSRMRLIAAACYALLRCAVLFDHWGFLLQSKSQYRHSLLLMILLISEGLHTRVDQVPIPNTVLKMVWGICSTPVGALGAPWAPDLVFASQGSGTQAKGPAFTAYLAAKVLNLGRALHRGRVKRVFMPPPPDHLGLGISPARTPVLPIYAYISRGPWPACKASLPLVPRQSSRDLSLTIPNLPRRPHTHRAIHIEHTNRAPLLSKLHKGCSDDGFPIEDRCGVPLFDWPVGLVDVEIGSHFMITLMGKKWIRLRILIARFMGTNTYRGLGPHRFGGEYLYGPVVIQ